MQHSENKSVPINPATVSILHNEQDNLETMTDNTQHEQHFLGLAHTLQSTLDIRKLLELYIDEVSAFVPHDGFRYNNLRENLLLEFGEIESNNYTYKLILLGKNLGEVTFFRLQAFTKDELYRLDRLVAALLYPVRNSLLYKRAVETAYRDPLTDLNNRAAMDNALDQELDFANRHNLPLTILMLDIDKFKTINDTYGHIAGDIVLKSLADCMRETVRRSDVIFRYGGEEFLILLRNTEEAGASLLANRIRIAVSEMICMHQEHEIRVTTSIGLARLNENEDKPSFLQRADAALYRAKEEGRNRVIIAE